MSDIAFAVEAAAMRGVDRPVDVVDVAIGVGLILLAVGAVFSSARKGAVMFFLGAGALMIPVWLRAGSVDLALAEAALGTGVLTALLLTLAITGRDDGEGRERGDRDNRGRSRRTGRYLRGMIGAVTAAILVAVPGSALLRNVAREDSGFVWDGPLDSALAESGADHGITAVLLNFRAIDTLLESAVLLFAALAATAIGRAALGPETQKETSAANRANPPVPGLRWFARLLAPITVLVAGWLLFAGTSSPGGAFQAGAVLAGGIVLMHAAGIGTRWWRDLPLTVVAVVGVGVFLAMAVPGAVTGGAWMEFDPAWAGSAIIVIETFLALGIAAALAQLYLVLLGPDAAPDSAAGVSDSVADAHEGRGR